MPYATLDLLTERYGEQMLLNVADRAPKNGVVDTAIVDRALADTDAVIDGYIAGRYSLPLPTVPPLLVDLALALAIYKLHPAAPSEKIRNDYTDALKSLDKIASGTIRLPIAGIEPTSSGSAGVETIDRERPFTPENMKGWI